MPHKNNTLLYISGGFTEPEGPAKVFNISIHNYTALSTVALTKLMKNTFATLICVLYTPNSFHTVLRNMV